VFYLDPIDATDAKRVNRFDADTTSPVLWEFGLNLTSEVLTMVFAETMDASTFRQGGLLLQGLADVEENTDGSGDSSDVRLMPDVTFRLQNGTQSTADTTIVTVKIPTLELNEIKRMLELGSRPNNTFLSMAASTIKDMNGNSVVEISAESGQAQTVFYLDRVQPQLVSYDLDINSVNGTIVMTFDETVKADTIDPTQLVFRSSQSGSAATYQLTGGVGSSADSTVVTVVLSIEDTNAIKHDRALATTNSSTYLSFGSTLISDMQIYDTQFNIVARLDRMNKVVAIPPNDAKAVTSFTGDTTAPELIEFDFNYMTEQVTLVF
jgi:hypothetical protein